MKKIFAILLMAAGCTVALAQNEEGKMDDLGRIALAPVILEESSIPPAAGNVVLNKLTQMVTQNGLASDTYDPRFIITANMVELSHDVTATAPPMQALVLSPTLYIGDASTGTLFATLNLGQVKGAGTNETKAYMQAVRMIKTNSPEVQRFIEKGKTRIIEWYNTQIDFIISEANALAGQDKNDEAIGLLFTVPTVCKDAYDKAMKLTADKTLKANIFHNVGNMECDQKHYEKAIQLYKQALILNPKDEDTRYNLAFAQEEFRKEEEARKMLEKMNDQLKKDEKPKPSKFAEECMKKAAELVQQFKFEEALKLMQDGIKKDKTVDLFNDFIKKLEGIVTIINDNKE